MPAVDDVKVSQMTEASPPAYEDRFYSPVASGLFGYDSSKRPFGVVLGTNLSLVGNVLTVSGAGGVATWGMISGTLSAQTDLQNALNAKLTAASNLSDLTVPGTALTNLGGTTVGKSFFTLANPSAITFPQINANNTVSALTASAFRTAIGAGTGAGTVTAVSVASANGFAGTSSGGATPALTLTTTITGVLKGNGTAISAATAGTDYSVGTSALATGILKSTTITGALTIAAAGDFPTLNQNTTGSAATLTTPRAIYGNNFDGSAALAQVIASTYGGTGNGFTKFTGPAASEKTFTLPNASATVLTDNAPVTVAQGGIGIGTLASNGVLYGNGTSAVLALAVNSLATNKFLTQSSSGAPAWATIVSGDVPNLGANPSGSVGLSAVNGTASTYIRSDGAPALSQAIVPTWTGIHTFSNGTYSALFTGGNVGIGVAAPTQTLQVNGTQLILNTSDYTGAATALLGIGRNTVAGDALLNIGTNQTNHYGFLQTQNAGLGYYNLLLNPNGGNVGIGTVSPGSILEIAGALTTADPASGTKSAWKLGAFVAGKPTGTSGYAQIDIAGAAYQVPTGPTPLISFGRVSAQTAAQATINQITVGAADSSYIVSANINVTASATNSFTCTCTYTDETNTSRVLTLTFSNLTGTLLQTITNVTGTGAYEGVPLHIRAKASTTITFATTGTFTSVTYNAEAQLQQIN